MTVTVSRYFIQAAAAHKIMSSAAKQELLDTIQVIYSNEFPDCLTE
jgi:hypothetical protein